MAKFDVESAYRLIPVHPDDRPLLGMKSKDQLYVEVALSFGLRSVPTQYRTPWSGSSGSMTSKPRYITLTISLSLEIQGCQKEARENILEANDQTCIIGVGTALQGPT